jgi:phage shock protein E
MMMDLKIATGIALVCLGLATPLSAQTLKQPGSPLIDYNGFSELTAEIRPYREQRLIPLADFKKRGLKQDTLILDARSAEAYAAGHIKGAVNLPLPDFNDDSLKALIGADMDREIMIYCNNNFTNNLWPIPMKRMMLALNIQTFINLYGYGYKNIYELGEAVDRNLPEVEWIGDKDAKLTVLR